MKRNRQKDSEGPTGHAGLGWMMSLTDLMTLLMAFFAIMFSMSAMDSKKLKDVFGGLSGALGVLELGKESGVGKEPVASSGGLKESLHIQDARLLKEMLFGEEEEGDESRQPEAEVFMDSRGLVVRLPDQVLFPPASAQLSPRGLSYLDKVAAFLAKTGYLVRVEGYADNTFTFSSSYHSNWDLSMARATVVLRHLINAGHLSPQGFATVAYADSRPIAPNDTEEGRARNRRVEVVLFKNS